MRYRDAAPGTLALLQVRAITFPSVVFQLTEIVLCRVAAVDNVHRSRRAEGQQPRGNTTVLCCSLCANACDILGPPRHCTLMAAAAQPGTASSTVVHPHAAGSFC